MTDIVILFCQFTRSFASFLLSHIGLLSLVVGYCIMGAFIFEELEKVSTNPSKFNLRLSKIMYVCLFKEPVVAQ